MKHFFSHETHVSFELPFGWEVREEKDNSLICEFELDQDMEEEELKNAEGGRFFNPLYSIDLFAMPNTDPGQLEKAAKAVFDQKMEGQQLLAKRNDIIDQHPSNTIILKHKDNDYGSFVVRHQSFVLVDDVLYSFNGYMPSELYEEGGEMFDKALKSVRFIFNH
jgi:hypothetical protein